MTDSKRQDKILVNEGEIQYNQTTLKSENSPYPVIMYEML